MRNFSDSIWFFLLCMTSLVCLFLGLIAGAGYGIQYVWENDQCSKYAILTGQSTYYSWSTPCYVKVGARWVTLDSLTKNNSDLTVREGK